MAAMAGITFGNFLQVPFGTIRVWSRLSWSKTPSLEVPKAGQDLEQPDLVVMARDEIE